jgi:hypothetical protein
MTSVMATNSADQSRPNPLAGLALPQGEGVDLKARMRAAWR